LACFSHADDTKRFSVNNSKYHHPLIVILDFDENGVLDFEEFKNAPKLRKSKNHQKRVLFDRFDKNSDEVIQEKELPVYQRVIPISLRPWMPELISNLDLDNDGYVSYQEFTKDNLVSDFKKKRQKKIFDNCDNNGDGKLSANDYQIRKQKAYIANRDLDEDSKVTYIEFKKFPWLVDRQEDVVKKNFNERDTNQDGFISMEDEMPKLDLEKIGMTLKP